MMPAGLPSLLAPEMRTFDVVALGECSIDTIVRLAIPFESGAKSRLRGFGNLPGGQAATAAVTCARQGHRVRFVGAVGTDDRARQIEAALRAEGVDAVLARRPGVRSRGAVVLVAPDGSRSVLEDREEGLVLTVGALDPAVATSGRLLLVDASSVEASIVAARRARASGVRTIVDVDRPDNGVDELLHEIDVIVVAEAFPEAHTGVAATGAALAALARQYRPALAIVTLGADGALAVAGGQEVRVPPPLVPVEDTTGAGDAFRGGLACAWLTLEPGASLVDVLRYANTTAALSCQAVGAQAGLPTRQQVERICNSSG